MILGLTGKAGAGKNTVARILAELYAPVVEVSFAAKLKQSFAALMDCDVETLERSKNDPSKQYAFIITRGADFPLVASIGTVREMLQRYGTEAHRDIFGADFWLDAALPVHAHYDETTIYVVTDVRFPNEVERVRALGGKIARVDGPDTDTGTHASERVPDGSDYVIDNRERGDGFEALRVQLDDLLTELGA